MDNRTAVRGVRAKLPFSEREDNIPECPPSGTSIEGCDAFVPPILINKPLPSEAEVPSCEASSPLPMLNNKSMRKRTLAMTHCQVLKASKVSCIDHFSADESSMPIANRESFPLPTILKLWI